MLLPRDLFHHRLRQGGWARHPKRSFRQLFCSSLFSGGEAVRKGQMRDGGRRTRDEGEERKQKRSFPSALLEKFNKKQVGSENILEKNTWRCMPIRGDAPPSVRSLPLTKSIVAACSLTSTVKIDQDLARLQIFSARNMAWSKPC